MLEVQNDGRDNRARDNVSFYVSERDSCYTNTKG